MLMKEIDPPVSSNLILICEKCGSRAKDLQRALKDQIKASGSKREQRAVLTGCLSVCPKKAVAVGVMNLPKKVTSSDRESRFFTIRDEEKDLGVVAEALLRVLET